jgi:regulator of protease activity HflC (stomatin/prohibitin superfamily)
MTILWTKIDQNERGLLFRDGAFEGVLQPGRHFRVAPLVRLALEKVQLAQPWFEHRELDRMVKSGRLGDEVEVLDLKDHERALVWLDGRLAAVCGPGVHALWKAVATVRIERIERITADTVRFDHPDLFKVLGVRGGKALLQTTVIPNGFTGLVFVNGRNVQSLPPGQHAFWQGEGEVRVMPIDLREQSLDIAGQEILTADKVSLRLNALVGYRVADAVKAVTSVEGFAQALYRQAQLALRAVVGTRELDTLLAEKDAVSAELEAQVRAKGAEIGLEVLSVGVRDIILPGEMREILNRVTAARKAAEVALITRREETAAMRSHANTARIFESNPTLMRLRELEVLEKVSEKANLSVVLGDGGLADRVVKML